MPTIEALKAYEIFDRFNNKWSCTIYRNLQYQEAPSFMRLRCSALNYNRIMETNNDEQTLLRLLRYITIYLDELQFVSHDTVRLVDVSPLPEQ
ncbi:hypothetical protein QA541_10095 [Macrococcus psychrotolerans]|uniref:Uncharacterized protein n=3 Tax=Macrococcus psychrotolerans TaxID=3039389 RepID=A0AAU6R8R7_9STAP|nr:hypothetical protein [Macrococcus sp. 19Msa1099]QYA32716.1 hypothetical protein KYI10_10330 [Macrococcus sp. 19Msa1099]